MIDEALLHCEGIGPVRLAQLHQRGIRTWRDVLANAECIPASQRQLLVDESHRCLAALEADEVRYFTECFAPQDKWRILSHFLAQASFFDIETVGLEHNAAITVISCWHAGQLHHFVEHENLDEFLELLDQITLLVSFNGSSFDVPRVLDSFHIPELPCAHLDMRWTCFHQGKRGGLKEIAQRSGIVRPADLQSADGELAVRLWSAWRSCQNAAARQLLIRYCAADVLMLVMLAHQQTAGATYSADELWLQLPAAVSPPTANGGSVLPDPAHQNSLVTSDADADLTTYQAPPGTFGAAFESLFGQASPQRLRARRSRLVG